MKVKTILDVSNVQTWQELQRYSAQILKSFLDVINGNVDLVDNCSTSFVSVTFSAANTETKVAHTLGRTPQGYIVAGATADVRVFDSSSASTADAIFLKASGAATVRLLVF